MIKAIAEIGGYVESPAAVEDRYEGLQGTAVAVAVAAVSAVAVVVTAAVAAQKGSAVNCFEFAIFATSSVEATVFGLVGTVFVAAEAFVSGSFVVVRFVAEIANLEVRMSAETNSY